MQDYTRDSSEMYESKTARRCMESLAGHNRSSSQSKHAPPIGDEVQVTLTEDEVANESEQEESFVSNQASDHIQSKNFDVHSGR